MKCKAHPFEYGVGVCASCLRDRLLALIAAQNELSALQQHNHHRWRCEPTRSVPQTSLLLNRPVSPYISHRRSVGSDASPRAHVRLHQYQRFFSTPQIGPTFRAENGGGGLGKIDGGRKQRFSIFKSLFGRHKSEELEPGFEAPRVSSSGSWFSALIPGRSKSKKKKKKKKSQFSSAAEVEEEAASSWRPRRSCQTEDRGMSPEIEDEDDEDSVQSSDEWRRPTPTPMRRFPANHCQHRSTGAVSGFSVCLSPLVNFGPESRRGHPAEVGISGDLRSPRSSIHHRDPPVGVAGLAPNRSRKLVDIGRSK
ncbi:hypothetical protein Cni_G27067 [Canna indica]|uniref:Uncharacterized protein n=1 Tax=Canna indica TaxID=4628 RepID=A0AAQ3L0J6_9LILI|nr:hypothetical protein Cni_G27067 [Canna indica]